MVTHDRYFLERITNKTLDIELGNVYLYDVNYSNYLNLKVERAEYQHANYRKLKAILKKEAAWAALNPQARSTKSTERLKRYYELEDKTNKLTPFSSKRLEQIANYILEDKNFSEISVTVHTDTLGDKEENQKVTDEQAKVIKDFFISKGVDENKLFIKSMGQEDPAVDNLNNDKSLINRRVLIQIVDENNR